MKNRLLVTYAIVIAIAIMLLAVKVVNVNKEHKKMDEDNVANKKVVETLKLENKDLKEQYSDLLKEKTYLERKVEAFEEDNSNELIDELEIKIAEMEKTNKELKAKSEELAKMVEERDKDIIDQDEELKKEVDNRYAVIEHYNQLVMRIVDILEMNPDIFEFGENGLIDPQYALNVIEVNKRDAMAYSYIQMILYEETGYHEPDEAIWYLIEQARLNTIVDEEI